MGWKGLARVVRILDRPCPCEVARTLDVSWRQERPGQSPQARNDESGHSDRLVLQLGAPLGDRLDLEVADERGGERLVLRRNWQKAEPSRIDW